MYKNTLTKFLDENVEKYPNRKAIIEVMRSTSFRELRDYALTLAGQIADALHGQTRKIVAVYLPKGIDSIAADIASGYSGNAYMNLDIKHPEQRIKNILESIEPAVLVTSKKLFKTISDSIGGIPLVCIDDVSSSTEFVSNRLLALRDCVLDVDLACIINTSGSTGIPKGVALTHRGFIDRIRSEEAAGILSNDLEVVASLAPTVFDHHSFEICLLMMKAATILIVPESFAAFPVRMLELMNQHRATFLLWVPTIMVNIANMDLLSKIPLPDLRKVWFAGEVFPTVKFNYWKKQLPNATFVNLYGPTEISVDCTYFIVDQELEDNEPIPIGRALPNTEVCLLDEDGKPTADGQEGEICVRGSCLALGYYNNPNKTRGVFVQAPFNRSYQERLYRTGDIGVKNAEGLIFFKGRKDNLIKHLGYRIELGEIENAASMLEGVKNCCVLYLHEVKRIVLVYEADKPIDEKRMHLNLGKVLPKYMVPTKYFFVREMPMNNNGKIDRLKLKELLTTG